MMKVLISMLAAILVICACSLEWSVTGRVFWVGVSITVCIGVWILFWLSEKFIEAIDFLTRFER